MKVAIEIIGWIGAALVLMAYGALSAHKMNSRSTAYQLMNIGGAIGLVINTVWNRAIPSAALNLVWMAIGVHALWKNSRPAPLLSSAAPAQNAGGNAAPETPARRPNDRSRPRAAGK